jgi:hypothetical protein
VRALIAAAMVVAVAQIGVPSRTARADDVPLTPEQLASAKKLYEEGKALYAGGKIPEAIAKLEESYRISRNAFLLYNIGLAYDQSGQSDKALGYYARFLVSAPADAPMRADVQRRVETLEKERAESAAPATATPPSGVSAANFSHQPVYSARPGTPVDLSALLPGNPPVAVTLFYRGTDEATFVSTPMTRTDQVFVGQIPAERVAGRWIQYYIEVRDARGALVHRWGKSTSPNLVNVEGQAPSAPVAPPSDDPLVQQQRQLEAQRRAEQPPMTMLAKVKWIATGGAVAMIGTTVVMYMAAKHESDLLHEDSLSCGTPPCRAFDADYDQVYESRGRRYQTLYYIGIGVSVAAVGVAGYLWYRDTRAPSSRSNGWALVPAIAPDFTGAAAGTRF